MENEKLKMIIRETVIEVISGIIAEKMKKKPKLLVVFSGGTLGLGDAIASINGLRKNNFEMDVVLSRNADDVLGRERMKRELGIDEIYVEGNRELLNMIWEADVLILPTLTVNSAAKIASCINDNYLTLAASHFILSGKQIISSTNCCCPRDRERLSSGVRINDAYGEKMISNMEQMEKYGIKFTYSKNIEKAVNRVFEGKIDHEEGHDFRDRKVITYGDVSGIARGSKLRAGKNSLVTPLAKDYLKSKDIEIHLMD